MWHIEDQSQTKRHRAESIDIFELTQLLLEQEVQYSSQRIDMSLLPNETDPYNSRVKQFLLDNYQPGYVLK